MCVRHAQRQRDREEYRKREAGREGGRERETLESCCLLPCGSRVELRSLNLPAGTFTHGTISLAPSFNKAKTPHVGPFQCAHNGQGVSFPFSS